MEIEENEHPVALVGAFGAEGVLAHAETQKKLAILGAKCASVGWQAPAGCEHSQATRQSSTPRLRAISQPASDSTSPTHNDSKLAIQVPPRRGRRAYRPSRALVSSAIGATGCSNGHPRAAVVGLHDSSTDDEVTGARRRAALAPRCPACACPTPCSSSPQGRRALARLPAPPRTCTGRQPLDAAAREAAAALDAAHGRLW